MRHFNEDPRSLPRSNHYASQEHANSTGMKHYINYLNVTLLARAKLLQSKLCNSRKRRVICTCLRIFRTLSWCWSFRHYCFHLDPGPDFNPVQGDKESTGAQPPGDLRPRRHIWKRTDRWSAWIGVGGKTREGKSHDYAIAFEKLRFQNVFSHWNKKPTFLISYGLKRVTALKEVKLRFQVSPGIEDRASKNCIFFRLHLLHQRSVKLNGRLEKKQFSTPCLIDLYIGDVDVLDQRAVAYARGQSGIIKCFSI